MLVDGWFTETWSQPHLLMSGSLKFELDRLGWWLDYRNLIAAALVDCWFTETWSRPSWSMAGSHLTWSRPPWLMGGSLKFDLDRLRLCLVDRNLISNVLTDVWFYETWSRSSRSISGSHLTWFQPLCLMAGSLKFDLDRVLSMAGSLKLELGRLDRWLVHCNLISSVFVDVWLTETWSELWLMTDWLKFDPDYLSRWMDHQNLISTVLVDVWLT